MREIFAFVRYEFSAAASRRVGMALSFVGLLASVVPLYYFAGKVQPFAASAIAGQARDYFTFALVGIATLQLVSASMNALPTAVAAGLQAGTLEWLLITPVRLPVLVVGMMSYRVLFAVAQGAVMLAAGVAFGAHFRVGSGGAASLLLAFGLLVLIVAAYASLGAIASACVIAFRTPTPLLTAAFVGSTLLGGAYYPTHVVPSWLGGVAELVPLTSGLRAIRQLVLTGAPVRAVLPDALTLLLGTAALAALGTGALHLALRYGRRTGSLSHF